MNQATFLKLCALYLLAFAHLLFPDTPIEPLVVLPDLSQIKLCMHVTPCNHASFSPVSFYYKGTMYSCPLSSEVGDYLRITEKYIPHSIEIVITPSPSYKKKRGKVVALTLMPDMPVACYRLYYTVNEDGVSYHWDIEKIEDPSSKIPEDAFVFLAHPDAVSIKLFDPGFNPACPHVGTSAYGVIILPTFIIDTRLNNHCDQLKRLDCEHCHVTACHS